MIKGMEDFCMLEESKRKAIGRNISTARQRCDMTRAKLAELTGVAVEDIVHGEDGDGEISLELLLDICAATGTMPGEILAGTCEGECAGEGASYRDEGLSLEKIQPEDRALMEHIYYFMANKKPKR